MMSGRRRLAERLAGVSGRSNSLYWPLQSAIGPSHAVHRASFLIGVVERASGECAVARRRERRLGRVDGLCVPKRDDGPVPALPRAVHRVASGMARAKGDAHALSPQVISREQLEVQSSRVVRPRYCFKAFLGLESTHPVSCVVSEEESREKIGFSSSTSPGTARIGLTSRARSKRSTHEAFDPPGRVREMTLSSGEGGERCWTSPAHHGSVGNAWQGQRSTWGAVGRCAYPTAL